MLTEKQFKGCNLHKIQKHVKQNNILFGNVSIYGGKTFKESKGKINTKPRITVIIISDGQRKGGNWGWSHKVLLGFGQGLLLTVGGRQDK